ncbi:MAG: hypothetical protein J5951_05930 [Bacteroidales bacterium]|nr:hypothetical protein [Bacteroidales bacterium]
MTTKLTIDGVNILSTYNVTLEKDAYDELIQWPEMRSVEGNDWQEVNGYEPDLSRPVLESRDVTLKFILKGTISEIDTFYAFLGGQPVRSFTFTEIGRTFSLRLVSMPSIQYARTFKLMQVLFAADNPLEGCSSTSPSSSMPEKRDYVIDGSPLSDYGIRVLRGTISSVIKGADVKPLLIRRSSVISGATYDENPLLNDADNSFDSSEYETIGGSIEGVSANWKRSKSKGTVTYKGRDITLKCLIWDTTSTAFRNYYALLYNLTKVSDSASDPTLAGARTINIRALGKSFKCFYKNQKVEEFLCRNGRTWIKFNLTLTLFQEEGNISFFLSTEDGGFVITEDEKLIPIIPAY